VGGINGDVYAYDADSGRRVWRAVTGSAVASITAGESSLFVASTDGFVTCLDVSSGEILWHDKIGGTLASPPVLFEDSIYFTTGYKTVYAYKIK
jgi:outer membrane protein assembly factor BamB